MARQHDRRAELAREVERLRELLSAERPVVYELEVHREQLETQREQLIHMQCELELSRDRYAELFDFSPTAYMALDRQGVIKEVNLTGARMLGAERNRVVGFPFLAFVAETDRRAFLDHLLQCRQNEAPHEVELVLRGRDDRTTPVHVTTKRGSPAAAISGAHFFVAIADVTERRRAEAERQRLWEYRQQHEHERALALAESEAKDRFIATLSHELRTPLTPILLAIATLERTGQIPDTLAPAVDMIRRNVAIEARLIDDLLDATRIVRGKLPLKRETVDLHAVIEDVIGLSSEDIRAGHIRVRTELDAGAHHTWADAIRMRQVFWNLLRNAIRYSPASGLITVRTANPTRDRVTVTVTDTGAGIAKEMLERIFLPFVQASRGRDVGLGLGLAIAKGVVEAHEGRIAATSEGPERGATFSVELAVVSAIPAALPAPTDARVPWTDGERRILLVEDNHDNATAIAELLRAHGYQVEVAHSVAAGLRLAAKGFDVLVSDIGLPDGTGRDLLRQLVPKGNVPAIALTGYGTDDDVRRNTEAGFMRHLTKPVDAEQLLGAIGELAQQRMRPGAA
jgi:PAS domain S-box-containing protein